jgi:hypothetical protein
MRYRHPFLHLSPAALILLLLIIIWSFIWKGIALWKSARNTQKAWFVVMLIVNTLGILEIIYIIWFSHRRTLESR